MPLWKPCWRQSRAPSDHDIGDDSSPFKERGLINLPMFALTPSPSPNSGRGEPDPLHYLNVSLLSHSWERGGWGGESFQGALLTANPPFVSTVGSCEDGSEYLFQLAMAEIQFIRGIDEEVVPDVKLTRARDGSKGQALFYFDNPKIVQQGQLEVMGMFMLDEEGELVTRDVNAKFVNGVATGIQAVYKMKSVQEWDRFIRFMDRYAESHGMGLNKSDAKG